MESERLHVKAELGGLISAVGIWSRKYLKRAGS